MRKLLPLILACIALPARADIPQPDDLLPAQPLACPAGCNPLAVDQPLLADDGTPSIRPRADDEQRRYRVNPEQWTLISAARGLSLHKPIYVYPLTYSPQYEGSESDFVFQFSAKHRVGRSFFFAYTQTSFWQIWDKDDSRPFRDTNYNPEVFYRWRPKAEALSDVGFDFGLFEHESNGRSMPESRSWNRSYAAMFLTRGRSLYYLKVWYRWSEDDKDTPLDPEGDDNPDIYRYYGYGELHFARQIGKQQQIAGMVRGNPATGKGAISLTYSRPNSANTLFYSLRLWHGYGETLLDYNRSTTRILLGVMLSR